MDYNELLNEIIREKLNALNKEILKKVKLFFSAFGDKTTNLSCGHLHQLSFAFVYPRK